MDQKISKEKNFFFVALNFLRILLKISFIVGFFSLQKNLKDVGIIDLKEFNWKYSGR